MPTLNVNGESVTVDVPADMPILWTLRDELGLTGTKFGCGMALCGACTVHLDGVATRSCITPISRAAGKAITTIEGIGSTPIGRKVQAAWQQDEFFPIATIDPLQDKLREARVTFDFHRYLTRHAFANEIAIGPGRIPATQYDPVWSQQAWDRTFSFFGRRLSNG